MTLREQVAYRIADCAFNERPGNPVRTDSSVEPGPWHYMLAEAAIAAVLEHATSEWALATADCAIVDLYTSRAARERPYVPIPPLNMMTSDYMRTAIRAALGDE